VATDAIGHGAQSRCRSRGIRGRPASLTAISSVKLNPSEAWPDRRPRRGRRATRDGTFRDDRALRRPFEPELAQALESHSFDSVKVLQWRNSTLDFASLGALAASLGAGSQHNRGLNAAAPIAEGYSGPGAPFARNEGTCARIRHIACRDRAFCGRFARFPDYRKVVAGCPCGSFAVTLFWIPDAGG